MAVESGGVAVFVQLLMVVADLVFNAVSPLFYYNNTVQLMLYVYIFIILIGV